jgi:glyoxylase-like metal-dependent hydrolase (beta-lactamase superfamily II)
MGFKRVSRLGFVNCYLVEEVDGLTLIDTMIPGAANRIIGAAGGKPIQRIVLTHAHQDHVGSLDALRERLPDAAVIIGARESRLLKKDMSLDPGEPQDELRGGYPGADTEPTQLIEPGDMVGSLKAIASPGHTPGHLSFLDTRDGTLFAGDAYATLGGVATPAKASPLFPLISMATWHKLTALESSSALAALDPARLAPGHGNVLEDPREDMEKAVEKASSALAALL